MPMKTSRTSNRRSTRTGRSSTGKLASCTDAPAEKLSDEEYSYLYDLINDAHSSNHRLVKDSSELDAARDAFAVAKSNLEIAEADLAKERDTNQRIHVEMAPLFHRLTA